MRRKLFLFASILMFCIVLADYAGLNVDFSNKEMYGKSTVYTGKVISIEEHTSEKSKLVVEIKGDMRVLLTIYNCDELPRYLWKAQIEFAGTMEKPQGRRNPGCFDYARHLKSEGIDAVIYVEELKIIQSQENHIENILIEKRFEYMASLSENCQGIVAGILFGDKKHLEENVYDQFRENGTAHILAVSGLHVGVLYGLIRKVLGKRFSIFTLTVTTLILFIYCFMALWSFSAVRATVMILMKEWGTYFDRRYDLLTAASVVAIGFMIYNPYTVYNAGFQMSFLAVLSISFLQRLIPRRIPDGVSTMIAVNIGLIPYQIFQFNILSVSSLIVNIPVIYIAGILMPFALADFVLYMLGCTGWLDVFVEALSSLLVKINQVLSLGNYGHYDMVSMPLWTLVFFYLTLFYFSSEHFEILVMRKQLNKVIHFELIFLIIAVLIGILSYNGLAKADILFVDVGQGDCIYIRAGSHNLLIDGGGSVDYNVGKQILKPYLLKNGVRRIDVALATHLHTDHYKGLCELNEEKMIKNLISGQTAGKNVLIKDNLKIKTIWPISIPEDTGQDTNESCSVFMILYNDYRILVTGDLDSEGEKKMMEYYKGTDALKADILKIGHHGSRYSTCDEFLDAVNPKYAVVQVGRNNYGHPNSKVIEKCEEKGIILFRNDTHGCVGFSLSGERITYGVQSDQNGTCISDFS